jgi:hypothetical protein
MNRPMLARAVAAAAVLAPALVGLTLPVPAAAQTSNTIRVSPAAGGGPFGATQPAVSSTHVARYGDLLGLSDDQRIAVKDMHQSYLNEHATATALMQQKIDDARAEADESGQFEGFIKVVESARKEFSSAVAAARTRFFDDLRLVLSPEQDALWPAVERTSRRVESIGSGALSAESIDLIQLVDDLGAPDDVRATVTPVLEAYEGALDTALVERAAEREKLRDKIAANGPGPGALLADPDAHKSIREASLKVREVNVSYARQIANILPTEWRAKFDTEFQRRSFPQVYAHTYTQRVLDTAKEFEDLTPDQRAQIEALRERLDRELDAANARWAEAVRADEEDPSTEVLIAEQFGTPMEIRLGSEPQALRDAKEARSQVVSSYLDQVRSLLSPEQQARLPRREPAQRGVGAGGGMRMMVLESTTTSDGSAPPPPPPPPPGR